MTTYIMWIMMNMTATTMMTETATEWRLRRRCKGNMKATTLIMATMIMLKTTTMMKCWCCDYYSSFQWGSYCHVVAAADVVAAAAAATAAAHLLPPAAPAAVHALSSSWRHCCLLPAASISASLCPLFQTIWLIEFRRNSSSRFSIEKHAALAAERNIIQWSPALRRRKMD